MLTAERMKGRIFDGQFREEGVFLRAASDSFLRKNEGCARRNALSGIRAKVSISCLSMPSAMRMQAKGGTGMLSAVRMQTLK